MFENAVWLRHRSKRNFSLRSGVRRVTKSMKPDSSCPKCGSTELQLAHPFKRHVNPWVFFFGGWLFSFLWSTSRKEEVRCVQCETVFQRATRVSNVAWTLLILFILLILLGLWAELFESK